MEVGALDDIVLVVVVVVVMVGRRELNENAVVQVRSRHTRERWL